MHVFEGSVTMMSAMTGAKSKSYARHPHELLQCINATCLPLTEAPDCTNLAN